MELQIRVTFARRSAQKMDLSETIPITWTLRRSSIALKYFKALEIAAQTGYFYRNDRFLNFPNNYYTEARLVDRLNEMIDQINQYRPQLIPVRASVGMNQESMSHLHTYFEKYRGPLLRPHSIYQDAPIEIKEAFDEFNLLIHCYEDEGYSGRKFYKKSPKFYATFGISDVIRRYPLADEDFSQFSFEKPFGAWMVNYCEVGKPLQDVFRDEDLEIGHEAILPLHYYSADGLITFDSSIDSQSAEFYLKEFNSWWDQNQKRLADLGFHKNDPKNAIGQLVVADLDLEQPILKGRSQEQIVELMSHYQWLSKVECLSQEAGKP